VPKKKTKRKRKQRVRRRRRLGPVQLMLPLQMPLLLDVAFLTRPMPPPFVEDRPARTVDSEQSSLFE
jgi:hypothetical protein